VQTWGRDRNEALHMSWVGHFESASKADAIQRARSGKSPDWLQARVSRHNHRVVDMTGSGEPVVNMADPREPVVVWSSLDDDADLPMPELGRKDDAGKADYSLLTDLQTLALFTGEGLSPVAQRLLAGVEPDDVIKALEHGVTKYGRDNWRFVSDPVNRYRAARGRHLAKHHRGEVIDQDSGATHAACAMCCELFLIELDPVSK